MSPALDSSLGIPVVYLVDDEDVVLDALAWLLRSRRLLSEGFASADAFGGLAGTEAGRRCHALAGCPGLPGRWTCACPAPAG